MTPGALYENRRGEIAEYVGPLIQTFHVLRRVPEGDCILSPMTDPEESERWDSVGERIAADFDAS